MKEKLIQIHKASIELLEKTGIELHSESILAKLKEYGVRIEGSRAYFTEEQINENLAKAPSEFTINARNPKYNMYLGGDVINYGPCGGAPKVREADGTVRDGNLDDYLKMIKLVQVSDAFKLNGCILIQPNDIDANVSHAVMSYGALTKSDKVHMVTTTNKETVKDCIDLLSIVFGEEYVKENPVMFGIISTISPLKIDSNALECMEMFAKYNQPMFICPAPMSGASGPVSLAGNIALCNAEAIAGIAIAQILKPGTPVVYGSAAMTTDMKTGSSSIGSPGFALQGKYCANLARMYNIPNRSFGGVSDANGPTLQAGYESAISLFAAHQEKANFVLHSAGILDGFGCMSFEKFIGDLELISMLRYYFDDIEVNEKTLALDVIDEVAEKGTFLTHKHTSKRCRKDPWKPTIALRGKLRLDDTPNNLMMKSINDKMESMLNSYIEPKLEEDTLNRLREKMLEIGVEKEVLEKIDIC